MSAKIFATGRYCVRLLCNDMSHPCSPSPPHTQTHAPTDSFPPRTPVVRSAQHKDTPNRLAKALRGAKAPRFTTLTVNMFSQPDWGGRPDASGAGAQRAPRPAPGRQPAPGREKRTDRQDEDDIQIPIQIQGHRSRV